MHSRVHRFSRALLPLAALISSAAHAQSVPPVAKGIKNDVSPRQTNAPIPLHAAGETWRLARSKHFVIISSTDDKRTRAVIEELETLASVLTQIDSAFRFCEPEKMWKPSNFRPR